MSSSDEKEKRISPRVPLDYPVNFQAIGARDIQSGLTVNVSETGLLIRTPKNMPVGTRLIVEVLFPKRFELRNLQGVAEIVWKDVFFEEKWEGYEYGLRIVQIPGEDQVELNNLLDRHSSFKTAFLSGESEEGTTLTIEVQ